MNVLGIESTCDETAASVVVAGKKILSNVTASQADLHARYGGVFPEMAARRHADAMIPVIEEALAESGLSSPDLIAVAKGPGLIGPLLLGLHAAKSLALAWKKPLIGVNHVEAHLYAAMMEDDPILPALGVVISGGHTFLVKIEALGKYTMIGKTVDDAIGEAFDKVAVMLGLSYPGGPALEQLARQGNPLKYRFQPGKVKGRPWDFSFSGLKTNVLYRIKGQDSDKNAPCKVPEEEKPHIAAAFQEVALGDIVMRAIHAAKEFECKAIYIGGGVSQNGRLRALFEEKNTTIPVIFPPRGLSVDNAAMIAGLGYHVFLRQGADLLDLEPQTRIPL
ncbi:MAG: tRNA (adenosine(37)-N6)-threonylcarbamoyltransferase complex transferase subunit TsaD [Verrucomicrobia bacterium]|nr:tRNA (adenosine(37)-N6)-threonylcarbamoyltransferase complex transferase subunit TsaD [Verrucomicrobiota bacterium]